MAAGVSDDDVTDNIVGTVEGKAYLDADTAAVELTPALLRELHLKLEKAKEAVESRVRNLSQDVAPDVDGWISRAKQVQADIERSKFTARSIVEQAQTQTTLRRNVDDSKQKVTLLEDELDFSKGLQRALHEIKSTSTELSEAKEQLVREEIHRAFNTIEACRARVDKIETSYARNAGEALRSRLVSIEQDLKSSTRAYVRQSVRIDADQQKLVIDAQSAKDSDLDLETSVKILDSFGELKDEAINISSELRCVFFSSFTQVKSGKHPTRIVTEATRAQLIESDKAILVPEALGDVGKLVALLAKSLPAPLYRAIADLIAPQFVNKLVDDVLTPSIPLNVERMGELDSLSVAVGNLSGVLRTHAWPGSDKLQEWMENAPRHWLSRQREHTLDAVRQSLVHDLGRLSQVEKVESQSIEDESAHAETTEDDGWDEGWTEDRANDDVKSPAKASANGDVTSQDAEDESAWGWDEKDAANDPTSPAKANAIPTGKDQTARPKQITLREVYTVTGVPAALLRACVEVLNKAEAMTGDHFSQSAVASAVTALYSIPTLAAALYRAMAVTAYDSVENGKMILYNDAMRLADQFRSLIGEDNSEPSSKAALTLSMKRKLEQEIGSLERFARLAYSAEMESQKTILYDLMDGAQGFSNCTTSPFAEECEGAIDMTVDRIGRIHGQWQDILSRSVLQQSTGGLLSAAVSKFMIDVQELADIGEEESKKLIFLSSKIADLSSMFTEQHAETGEVRDMTILYCPNWLKFQYLREILDGSLADIKYLWTEGELGLEFDEDEVIDLIQALFADSDHRRKAISAIKASRR